MSKKDFETTPLAEWADTIKPNVISNLVPINIEERGVALHIDNHVVKEFYPMVSRRLMDIEDNTVPRVTVAATLLGCIVGYGYNGIIEHFNNKDITKKIKDGRGTYVGAYYIHEIPYDWAVAPNNKLVPDADRTDEFWLVNYGKDHSTYPATVVGQFFLKRNTTEIEKDGSMVVLSDIYLEYKGSRKLAVKKGMYVENGYYKITIFSKALRENNELKPYANFDKTQVDVTELSRSEYMQEKVSGIPELGAIPKTAW
jgi:hypothetical protein